MFSHSEIKVCRIADANCTGLEKKYIVSAHMKINFLIDIVIFYIIVERCKIFLYKC